MIYTIYIPKYKGDNPDYNITKVISDYMRSTEYPCKILAAPGYMNRTVKTTNEFYDKMEPILQPSSRKSRNTEVGIFNGMNGTTTVKRGTTSYREEHEKSIVSHKLGLIPLQCKEAQEHQKMLFFMEKKEEFNTQLTISNYKEFLSKVIVHGVLIGSSNQNLTTYYGGINGVPASKGEADVFMFVDEEAEKAIYENESLRDSVVISKSIYVPGNSNTGYLKSILENFLKNSLA